ncbi:kinase-like domain-containing protein [Lophiotrema nucula]|uniref:Kinase-like domain-containing protein n=1 Tax=Lophiotrema nucula TaxID=690887 RepID=A0A6A5ZDE4_9PLEO|nr:kinase-like domain-containing protein [Lophiotrema nucula]
MGSRIPIHIGVLLDRYEIVNKLSVGGYSIVWAALDRHTGMHVSLKALKAAHSEDNMELRILQHLARETQHPGRRHIAKLLHHFDVHVHGKKNLILVMELLGPNLRDSRLAHLGDIPAFNRLVSRQLVFGAGLSTLEWYSARRLPQRYTPPLDQVVQGDVTREDGAPLPPGLPRHIVMPLYRYMHPHSRPKLEQLQIIDFSTSFFATEPHARVLTMEHVAAPELIFRMPASPAVDIWSLACTIFYIATKGRIAYPWGDDYAILPCLNLVIGESSAQWLLN